MTIGIEHVNEFGSRFD